MHDLISAIIEPNVKDDYLTNLKSNPFHQGEDDGDPSIPLNLEDQICHGNLSLLAKS